MEIPGPLTEALGEIAREHGVWLVPGSVYERGGGRAHPQHGAGALPRGRAGRDLPQGRSRGSRTRRCAPGDRFVTFDIPEVGRVGLAICYDGSFPETFRQLAWMGAEVVLQPTLTTTSDRDAELVMARANAIFNQLYVVSSTPRRRPASAAA